MKSTAILLFILCNTWLSESRRHHHNWKRNHRYEDKELQRTKRDLDTGRDGKLTKSEASPIRHSKRNKRSSFRPYVAGQVQDVRVQVKLKMYWNDELANKYTPQSRLLAGNVIDEVSNALIDNRNFVEAAVLKFRPSRWNVLVDLSVKFFKTEVDPLHYLEGIVASGWISGLQVFSNYFKVIKIVNGNVNFPVWNYPKGLRLRLHPAILTRVNAAKKAKHKVVLPANYKEIRISFQLYQKWNTLFLAKFSSPYRLLSGNIEESLDHAFIGSPNYLDSHILGFRESHEGQCIVDMYVRFSSKEVYPAQKLKILISSGNVADTPVISDSLEIYEINNVTSDQPIQESAAHEDFPRPFSDADVNQGGNETEIEKGKKASSSKNPPVQRVKETSKPIYPLANQQTSNKENARPVSVPASSDEASMYLKLQHLRLMKQTGFVITEHQSIKIPEAAKENVVEETSQAIYPEQSKIDVNGGVVVSQHVQQQPQPQSQNKQKQEPQYQYQQPPPQQQQSQAQQKQQRPQYQYQQQQQQQLQSQQMQQQQQPQYQYQQQQQQPQQYQYQQPQQQQLQPQQKETNPFGPPPAGSQKQADLQPDINLWQSLPEQVEGKLVMNPGQPAMLDLNGTMRKGNEKQLASSPAKTQTDLELEKLQKDAKEQVNRNSTGNVDVGGQGPEYSLVYSSDTPTLTKTLYPQIAYSANQSKAPDAVNGATLEQQATNSSRQENFLQLGENFLTEKHDNQSGMVNTSKAEKEADANELSEDHKTIATMVAGVLSEQVKHFKAVQVQTMTYAFPTPSSNQTTNKPANGENIGQQPKQEQGASGTAGPQISEAAIENVTANNTKGSSYNQSRVNGSVAEQWPYYVNSNRKADNMSTENKTVYTVASDKTRPLSGIGAASWSVDAPSTISVQASPLSSGVMPGKPLSQNQDASYVYTQGATKPEQPATNQQPQIQPITNQQQQTQPITNQQQQAQPITYQQQQAQPITSQQQQAQPITNQQQQAQPITNQQQQAQPINNQQQQAQPITNQQQQAQPITNQQQQTQPITNQQQQTQPITNQQQQTQPITNQQQQTQPITNQQQQAQPITNQQQQTQPISKPGQPITYQQQQIQPITNQQQQITNQETKQASNPSSEAQATTSTSQPVRESSQKPQSNAYSLKPNAISLSYPVYNYMPSNGKANDKERNTSSNVTNSSSYSGQSDASPQSFWPLATPATKQSSDGGTSNENRNETSKNVNGYDPNTYIITTLSPLQGETDKQSYRISLRPHIYTPKIKLYRWPPVATPLAETNPPSQSNNSAQFEPVVAAEKEMTAATTYHSLHGQITLKQTWHPLLTDKNSIPYTVLKKHIEHSIEETYMSHHIRVSCKVVGLKKSHRESNRTIATEKVGVDFDLMFASNEMEVVQTMNQVAKNGVISELLVFPDSLSVQDDSAPNTLAPANQNQKTDQSVLSSSSQSVVATSPMPLDNAIEARPENSTKVMTFNASTMAPIEPTKAPEPSFEFVTAPKDTPKSCEEIRDSGIGKSDGQYVLEARKGCHLSVICQNMDDKQPKEFLGGPNRREWEAYPFAVLIKISAHDKENIQSGACLENSDEGRKLLDEIVKAKGKQKLPSPPWQTNIKRLLEGRKKREIKKKVIVIVQGDTGESATNRFSRSTSNEDADWGIL